MSLLTVKCEQGVACMTRSVQPSPKEFTVHYCHARDIEAAMLETPQHICDASHLLEGESQAGCTVAQIRTFMSQHGHIDDGYPCEYVA